LIATHYRDILSPARRQNAARLRDLEGESQMKRVLGLLLALAVMVGMSSMPGFSHPQEKKEKKAEKAEKKGEKKGAKAEKKAEKGEKKKGEKKKSDK